MVKSPVLVAADFGDWHQRLWFSYHEDQTKIVISFKNVSLVLITARKRSCGKVILLHQSVSHSAHRRRGSTQPLGRHSPWQTPPRHTPQADTPLSRHPPPGQTPPQADSFLGRHPPWAHTPGCRPPRQTPQIQITWFRLKEIHHQAGSTHPTGMHSCYWIFSYIHRSLYRSETVNSNMVNSKFHLIRSYCEIFFYHFPNIPCLKCTVNSNFHLIRSKTLLTDDFELTVPDLYCQFRDILYMCSDCCLI